MKGRSWWEWLFGPPNPPPTPPPPSSDLITEANTERKKHGLTPLEEDLCLSQKCAEWAEQHAARNSAVSSGRDVWLSHDGYDERLSECGKIPWKGSENVAAWHTDERHAVEGWMDSSGHRKNLLGGYNTAGGGRAQDSQGRWYHVMLFYAE